MKIQAVVSLLFVLTGALAQASYHCTNQETQESLELNELVPPTRISGYATFKAGTQQAQFVWSGAPLLEGDVFQKQTYGLQGDGPATLQLSIRPPCMSRGVCDPDDGSKVVSGLLTYQGVAHLFSCEGL